MASSSTQPWTPEEIQAKASSWSLEGDSKLLEFMQSISENLDKRASKTTSSIHQLSLEVDRTKLALENVTNQLAALQHSQFVENRVYEDDETLANESEVPAGDQEESKTKYDPIETLTKLLNDSMSVVERNFEKVSIEIDDSDEDEDTPKSVIYRPRDPYEHQPLPHLIGSKEWMEKWHIGICDSDEDFSGEEKEDEYSDSSESASMSTSLPSNAPTISESEFSAWGLQQNAIQGHMKRGTQSYESSDEDLSATTKESFDPNRLHSSNRAPMGPYRLPAPSTDSLSGSKYYVHQPKQRDAGLFDESTDESSDSELYNVKGSAGNTVPYPAMRHNNIISHIFSDEPPPDTDVVDKQTKPGIDLFCGSEDEGRTPAPPTMASVKKEDTIVVASKIRKKTVNLFDDDEFDSFMKELNTKTQEKAAVEEPRRNLFDESSGEEDALQAVNPKTKDNKINLGISRNVENDKQETIKNDQITNMKAKNSENVFNEADRVSSPDLEISRPLAAPRKTLFTSLFSDEPPDDDFDSLFSSKSVVNKKESQPNIVTSVSLSDDSEKGTQTAGKVPKINKSVPHDIAKIENEENDHMETKHQTKPKLKYSNLFGDESDDDSGDLFDKIVSGPTTLAKPEFKSTSSLLESHKRNSIEEIKNEIPNNSENENIERNLQDIVGESGSERKLVSKFTEHINSNIFIEETSSLFDEMEPYEKSAEVQPQSFKEEGVLKEKTSAADGNNVTLFSDDYDAVSADFPASKQPSSLVSNLNEAVQNLTYENRIAQVFDEIIEDKPEKEKAGAAKEAVNKGISKKINEQKTQQNSPNNFHVEEFDDPVHKENPASDKHKKSRDQIPNVDSAKNTSVEQKRSRSSNLTTDELQAHSVPSALARNDLSSDNENSDANSIFRESISNPTTSSSITTSPIFSTILFSDVPPTDDEAYYRVPSKEIRSLDNDLESEDFENPSMDTSSSALNYNPISLFHDIPPDDDFDAMPRDGKKLHSIFYDDFSETIIPSQIESKTKYLSSFIFDEPPPDSPEEDSKVTETVENSSIKKENDEDLSQSKQRLDSESKIASIIDRMQKVADDEPSKSGAVKTMPSPKKLNMNLNINVSALLPGAKRKVPKVADSERNSEDKEVESAGATVVDADDVANKSCKTVQIESDPSILQSLNRSRAKIQVKRRPSTRKARQDNYRRSLIESEDEKGGNSVEGVTSNPAIFEENYTDQNVTEPSCNADNDSNADLFSNPSAEIGSMENRNESAPKHETFKLFNDNPPMATTTAASKDDTKKLPSLLFDSKREKVPEELFQTSPTKPVVEVATVKSTKQNISRNTSKPIVNNSAIGLFGDESDDDDLFKNNLTSSDRGPPQSFNQGNSTTGKVAEPTIVKQSIFGSDDEDDDLFGSGSTSDIGPKTVAPTKPEVKKLNSSRLFDDEEDDDDLFGGGDNRNRTTPQQTTKSSTSAKKIEIKKAITIPTPSTDKSDFKDPLADLFKN